jgi:3-deoxy-D-manno-octulosonic-acid transferase
MADRAPFLVAAYRGLARLLTPLFNLLFLLRSRSGKEIAARKGERFGRARLPRPPGRLVWIHAASVGETMSVLPLIERLVAEKAAVLLTTVTVTAAELAEKRLPEGALHQFVPYDAPGPIRRFLAHWSPDLAMVVESEIWPCLFEEMRRRDIPFVLVNGRLSDGSRRNWSRLPRVARYIFGCLDLVLAQSKADAARFRKLGCARVEVPGNLKFDAAAPAADEAEVGRLRAMIGARPVWLAALTHPGEEEIALAAHRELRAEFADLLLVLVPRHPARADAVAEMLRGQGEKVARRSMGENIAGSTSVYLGDTLGEMGLYYRLAPVTFLGGSFNDAGGHNPVEAALAGSALVSGPNVSNARAVYKDFWISDAAKRAATAEELTERVALLLREPDRARQQADRAGALVAAGRGALAKTMAHLKPFLAGATGNGAGETRA